MYVCRRYVKMYVVICAKTTYSAAVKVTLTLKGLTLVWFPTELLRHFKILANFHGQNGNVTLENIDHV